MKRIILSTLVLSIMGLSGGTVVEAHLGDAEVAQEVVSTEEFEDRQEVMIKMMNGEELTEAEAQDMAEFMVEHHSTWGPMMMWSSNLTPPQGNSWSGGMMSGSNSNATFGYWMMILTTVVWLVVGILLVAWLVRKLGNKDNQHE